MHGHPQLWRPGNKNSFGCLAKHSGQLSRRMARQNTFRKGYNKVLSRNNFYFCYSFELDLCFVMRPGKWYSNKIKWSTETNFLKVILKGNPFQRLTKGIYALTRFTLYGVRAFALRTQFKWLKLKSSCEYKINHSIKLLHEENWLRPVWL